MADVDLDQSCTLNKKIRNAQLAQYNFIFGIYDFLFIILASHLTQNEKPNMVDTSRECCSCWVEGKILSLIYCQFQGSLPQF